MLQFAAYTPQQWLLFFYFYCFFGWCFESSYVSIRERRLVNRGFMRGPFLPIYGCGAIIMLFATLPVKNSIALIFLCGGAAATLLEYVTGVCMEWLFKVRYWDYSKKKCNVKGYICLSSSLAWSGLSVFLIKVLHVPVESVVLRISAPTATIITDVLTAIVAVDMALSVKAAIDIRNVLVQLAKIKEETEKLHRRIEQTVQDNAVLSSFVTKIEEVREERLAVLHGSVQKRIQRLRDYLGAQTETTAAILGLSDKFDEMKERLSLIKERTRAAKSNLSLSSRMLLRGSPSVSSRRYEQALSELNGGKTDSDIQPENDDM